MCLKGESNVQNISFPLGVSFSGLTFEVWLVAKLYNNFTKINFVLYCDCSNLDGSIVSTHPFTIRMQKFWFSLDWGHTF